MPILFPHLGCRFSLPVIGMVALLSGAALARQSVAPVLELQPVVTIPRIDHPPKLEEFLGMQPGPGAPAMAKVSNFVQLNPKDGAPAQQKTDVYIGYDVRNFYAVFVCFDSHPGKIRARMTRREDIGPEHDEVQLYLDTFNDKRRAYGFMINPLGIQFDYIWTDDNGYDTSWDAVWDSGGKVTPQGYVALMSIPFKSLRFGNQPDQTWGIIFQRVIPHDNDNSFYPHISSSIQGRLRQEAELKGLQHISPGRNIQLNPYGVANAFRNLDQRDPNHPFFTGNHLGATAGLDGKMIIHDSLVLDFTVNPDFRQLESDQPQNTVNQRFEVFFPEKRPFFQEGANFFNTPVNLYFTRRIEDPFAGLRLTGKLGPYGIGILAVDDRGPGRSVPDDDPLRRKRAYFTVGRFTRELWKQSQVGVFYSDREMSAVPNTLCTVTALTTTLQTSCITNANRVGGADFTFHFGNHFQTQGQAVTSTNDQADGTHLAGNLYQLYAEYSSRHIEYQVRYTDVSSGFVTLSGFFQRPDIIHESHFGRYLFRPEGKIVTDYGPQLFHSEEWDHEGNRLTWYYEPGFQLDLKANTSLQVWHGITREQLRPVDFSILPRNVDFNKGYNGFVVNNTSLKFVTFNANFNWSKSINFDPPANLAPFLANETSGNLTASMHPWNPLTIDNSYVIERLVTRTHPAQGIVNSHIIRTKFNYQYNPQLSFRAIFQYNTNLVNPIYSTIDPQKNFNSDFLVTYLVHPGTAFYVGYNSNLENFDPLFIATHSALFRTRRSFLNDGREIFAKVSYLFHF
jgi:hypothetical protein